MRIGLPLPAELAKAAWGQPASNGLRSACLIEPDTQAVAIGSRLKIKVLVHNSGQDPVVFLFPQHAEPNGLRVSPARIHVVPWTQLVTFQRVRLNPGDYIEGESFEIAIEDHYDQQKAETQAVIETKAGSEFNMAFHLDLTERFVRQPDGLQDPDAIQKRTIANRLAAEAPLPASSADRTLLLRRVLLDMFGEHATAQELSDFAHDDSPNSLKNLTTRLQARQHPPLFVGEIHSGELTLRVTPAPAR